MSLPFEPKVGMVCGTTSMSPLAHSIRWFTAGPGKSFSQNVSSHILNVIRWRDGYRKILDELEEKYTILIKNPPVKSGDLIGVEATWPRVRFLPLEAYTRFGHPHYVFAALPNPKITTVEEETVSEALVRKIGTPYDLKGLFESIGYCNDDPNKEYCSEVARTNCAAQGYVYPPEFKFGVSPWDWQKHFEATGLINYRRYPKFWG